jgi:hypothetical protein
MKNKTIVRDTLTADEMNRMQRDMTSSWPDFISRHGVTFTEYQKEIISLYASTEAATQRARELSASIDAIKSRYHPIVWFFIRWIYGL